MEAKHHYLPVFYLKGFVGSEGNFAVFDKKEKRLKKRRLTPSQVFFEYDRNTYEINGVKDDFVEKLYGKLETMFGRVFKKIREQHSYSSLETNDMFNIILFVGSIYWRIPETDDLIKDVIANSAPDELSFRVFNKITGTDAPNEFYNLIKNRESFTGAYRMIKPVIDYIKYFDPKKIEDWKVYFATLNEEGERKEMHVIGDNPIIFKQTSRTNIYDQELIMPLTSGKTLYHTRGKDISLIDPSSRINVDRLIFLQSERYVCSPNSWYLESIAEQSYKFQETSPRAKEFLRDRVFNIFS